ncbi:MAG: hypothetical protein ACI849_001851 [Patiriisocius sp.]
MKYFYFILLCFSCCVFAQDSLVAPKKEIPQVIAYDSIERTPLTLSSEILAELKKEEAFRYIALEETSNWWTDYRNWMSRIWHNFWDWLVGDYDPNGLLAFIINVLPYLIVAAVVVFIIWLFYRLNPGAQLLRSSEDPQLFFTEEEEIIKSKNIQILIENAIQEGNYRLAIRYYYLHVLQSLSEKEIIVYQFDKTNTDYLKEISEKNIQADFKKATTVYNYIWYGNFEVGQEEFKKAQEDLIHLETQIQSSK